MRVCLSDDLGSVSRTRSGSASTACLATMCGNILRPGVRAISWLFAVFGFCSYSVAELKPFVLPFDDEASGVTNVGARLNHKPAGKFGSVVVDGENHFSVGSERIRFFGVNITSASCFPSHENAEKVAARLAKFGVNAVRFHHMDNNWGPSLIDYSQGNSRSLHAGNLEKLDYFVAELKKWGIYSNINLINSREFMSGDGLPSEIDGMDWKAGHLIGFLYEPFRDLEKEFAASLLNHVNPYTGLTYAEDPAIAFVEVNNENGLFQQYFDGTFDGWPDVFKNMLQSEWNIWLQSNYATTAEAETAWEALDEPLGTELISNGDFSSGTSGWNLEQHSGAAANLSTGEFNGRNGARLVVTQPGSATWHVQLNQGGLGLTEGQLYTVSFWARADSNLSLTASSSLAYDPWSGLDYGSTVSVTSEWQRFESSFISNYTDANTRINFNGFGTEAVTLYLSDVTLRPGGELGTLPEGETIEGGTVANNSINQGYTTSRSKDWARFLLSLEYDYWADMHDYIDGDLNFNGLVTGTTIMNSPPSSQKEYPFADVHRYWDHPQFPGTAWDPNNWLINNTSLVNTVGSTIAWLSGQRIKGMPLTLSEYQHSFPNDYGAEGPLLIGAYGSLQDWDGIYFFAYDAQSNDNWDGKHVRNYFSMNAHPTKMANTLVAANLFRRGDVKAAENEVVINFDVNREIEILATRGGAWSVANAEHLDVDESIALTNRLSLDVADDPGGVDDPPSGPSGPTYPSDTGELMWDLSQPGNGIVTVDTAHTKSVVGFANGRDFDLGGVKVDIGATELNWATVALTMMEGSFESRTQGGRGLIVATGKMENTNMQWTDGTRTSVGPNWGEAPTVVEVISAVIDLPFPPDAVSVWALDEVGQRGQAIPVRDNGSGDVQFDLGTEDTIWYEVEIASSYASYDEWAAAVFNGDQLADPLISAEGADPDGDGMVNLMELFFGYEPLIPDGVERLGVGMTAGDAGMLVSFLVDMGKQADPGSFALQVSADMESWVDVAFDDAEKLIGTTEGSLRFRHEILGTNDLGSGNLYARVKGSFGE
ncbi:MAG: carbohydrate binding domain-containing protein [Verrucomicrobiota bacterium]